MAGKDILNLLQTSNASPSELVPSKLPYAGLEVSDPGPVVSLDEAPFSHSWTVFVHSSKPLRSVFLMNIGGFDPYAEFRIKSVQLYCPAEQSPRESDHGIFQTYPSHWIALDGSEIKIPENSFPQFSQDFLDRTAHPYVYQTVVVVETAVFGTYDRTVVFDFGSLPKLGTRLVVDPEYDAELNLTDRSETVLKFDTSPIGVASPSKNNAIHYSPKELVPFVARRESNDVECLTDFEKELLERNEELSNERDPVIPETWTRANYRSQLINMLNIEESARKSLLDEKSVSGKLEICQSYKIAMTDSLMSSENSQSGELKFAKAGQLFAKLKLAGCLSEDHPAGRLLCQQTESAILDPESSIPRPQGEGDRISQRIVFECKIADQGREYLYLTLSPDCIKKLSLEPETSLRGRVSFRLNRLPFAEMRYAVEKLEDLSLVFPEETKAFRKKKRVGSGSKGKKSEGDTSCDFGVMNENQMKVIEEIGKEVEKDESWPTPVIVTGPFGTGKTFTLAQVAKRVLTQSRITRLLICTQSNSAADLYVTNFFHQWYSQKGSTSPRFPRPLRVYYVGRWLTAIPNIVRDYCCLEMVYGVPLLRWPNDFELRHSRLVITTLSTAKALLNKLESGWFSHILIDEAGQASEPQTLIPLCLAGPKTKIVLAGDPLQSGAECYSMVAKRCGLGRSLLERLWGMYPKTHPCRIHLTANYRSHAALLKFMSDNFYGQSFLSCSELPAHPSYYPLSFVATRGIERQDANSTAFFNNAEAIKTVAVVEDIVKTWPRETWGPVKLNEIGVLSVYTDQVQRIRTLLKKRNLTQVNVERVQNVQGKEYKVVILSTVRTLHTCDPKEESMENSRTDFGFLSHPRLLNTALTRAQTLVVVVGDAASLCSIGSCKQIWRKFVKESDREESLEGTDWERLKSHFEIVERSVMDKDNIQKFYWNPLAPEFRPRSPLSFNRPHETFFNEDLEQVETYTALIRIPNNPNRGSVEIKLPVELVKPFLPERSTEVRKEESNGEKLVNGVASESRSSSVSIPNTSRLTGSPLVAPPPVLSYPPPAPSPAARPQWVVPHSDQPPPPPPPPPAQTYHFYTPASPYMCSGIRQPQPLLVPGSYQMGLTNIGLPGQFGPFSVQVPYGFVPTGARSSPNLQMPLASFVGQANGEK